MKKLLGLLTIAPMALTACGSAEKDTSIDQTPIVEDTIIINNDVRYSETDNVLILTHFTLESYDDFTGYNEIGTALQNAYTENPEIGKATKVHLEGEVGGVTKNYDIDVNGILDDTGTDTHFTNFQGAIDHNWTAHGDYTGEAYFAKHVIEAGDHITPSSPTTEERDELTLSIIDFFEENKSDNKYIVKSDYSHDEMTTEFNKVVKLGYSLFEFPTLDLFKTVTGINQSTVDDMISIFENTHFIFESVTINKTSTANSTNWIWINFHHESKPAIKYTSKGLGFKVESIIAFTDRTI